MKQSASGVASCYIFAGALILALGAWWIISGLRPSRDHMDLATPIVHRLIAAGLALLIAFAEAIGLILGLIGLRQAGRRRFAAWFGTVSNGLGLLSIVTLIVRVVLQWYAVGVL